MRQCMEDGVSQALPPHCRAEEPAEGPGGGGMARIRITVCAVVWGSRGPRPRMGMPLLTRLALHHRYLCRAQRHQRVALIAQVELGEHAHPPAPAVGVIAACAERNERIGLATARAHPDAIHGPTLSCQCTATGAPVSRARLGSKPSVVVLA